MMRIKFSFSWLQGILSVILVLNMELFLSQLYGQVSFQEDAPGAGIQITLDNWVIGTGMSFFDFTQDGLDDLTIGTDQGNNLLFFVNNGSGSFDQIEPIVSNSGEIKQIHWVDFDNDGDPDLYLSVYDGINRLYENTGNLVMQDITQSAGFPLIKELSVGASWGDYNRDGWLDLYYCTRSLLDDDVSAFNRLFRNNANGSFTEVTTPSGTSDPGKLPFCPAFIDFNNDLWPDIYIANDKLTVNTLFRNEGDGTFTDVSAETGANARMNAMCVNPADVNGDGLTDIYITNTPVGNKFLVSTFNDGRDPYFTDFAESSGTGYFGNGWASNFLDADNDGDLDLYVSGSYVGSHLVSSTLFENDGHMSFRKINSPEFLKDTTSSFCHIIGDIDQNGLLDIVVQNNPPFPYHVWINTNKSSYGWIKIGLEGVMSNLNAIGSRIEVHTSEKVHYAYTHCGISYLGQNSAWIHFGLGDAPSVDSVVIHWPSGHRDHFRHIAINEHHRFLEGQSTGGVIFPDENVHIVARDFSTAVPTIFHDESVLLWPNPASSEIFIQSEVTFDQIEILGSSGELIYTRKLKNAKEFSVDTRGFLPGIIVVRLRRQDRSLIRKVVVLNH